MSQPFIQIAYLNVAYQNKEVFQNLSWTINVGENWLLSGPSGTGKTVLAKAIMGEVKAYGMIQKSFDLQRKVDLTLQICYVDNWYQFKDLEGQSNFYYQQRYTSQATATIATVREELKSYAKKNKLQFIKVKRLLKALDLSAQLDSPLIQLSSGEHKKLQLIKALWVKPYMLILDQPYNGLDKSSRKNLNLLLDELCGEGAILILISNDTEIPSSINRYAEIREGKLNVISADERNFEEATNIIKPVPTFLQEAPAASASDHIIKMIDVNISYGEKQVLKNINWEVKPGEKWLLQGHNGSGKSTLLSLISGDHPQAYANNFYLFGHKRGSGESIWEIKERIGLISPELHWYFDASATVWQSIVSGFFDSSGLFCNPGSTKHAQADELLNYFGLEEYRDRLMTELPLGKQRLALLARTIIKNPQLLILDEPCQGLDQQQTQHFNRLVDELCKNGTTLIYVGHFESALPACLQKRILLENGEVKSVETIENALNVLNVESIESVENVKH